ncbi:MAG: STAS domain-containing protein [Planctomycetota bacterium]
MEITSKINNTTYLIEIEGAIVGIYAEELDKIIYSINFTCLGINNLIFNLARTSMIDSIGIETINHVQERGLKVSILNPQGLVKDMLERASITGRLSHFLQIVDPIEKVYKTEDLVDYAYIINPSVKL